MVDLKSSCWNTRCTYTQHNLPTLQTSPCPALFFALLCVLEHVSRACKQCTGLFSLYTHVISLSLYVVHIHTLSHLLATALFPWLLCEFLWVALHWLHWSCWSKYCDTGGVGSSENLKIHFVGCSSTSSGAQSSWLLLIERGESLNGGGCLAVAFLKCAATHWDCQSSSSSRCFWRQENSLSLLLKSIQPI